MPNKATDATWRLARIALAHDLGRLFESRSVNANAAIADAVGVDRRKVQKTRFFYRLGRGCAAGISGTKLKWRDVVALLQADEGIRPAMEIWNATLWPFLRGELTPNVGISDLVDHHLAKVKYTRVGTGWSLISRLAERAEKDPCNVVFPVPAVKVARLEDIPSFLESTIAVPDKLTIAGLLYVEAYLGGLVSRAKDVENFLIEFRGSNEFEDAFGPATREVWAELRNRLYSGRLPFAYWQRSKRYPNLLAARRILLPTYAAEGFLENVVDEMVRLYDRSPTD